MLCCTSVYADGMKATRTLATALLAVSLTAMSAAPVAPATEPVQAMETMNVAGGMQAPVALMTWPQVVVASTVIELPAGTTITLTNERNCGAEASPVGLGGCTRHLASGAEILVSPELANTVGGFHILLHEIGHATGITDECGAEDYAHEWSAEGYWAYPACATR